MSFVRKPLILASGSLRRRQLLEALGVKFEIRITDINELLKPAETPAQNVIRIAEEKVMASAQPRDTDVFILGADTLVVLGNEFLGKPQDRDEAVRMLRKLSNHTHQVYTGFCLMDVMTNRQISDYEVSDVTFRELSADEIECYVSTGAPMDKAGAYGIQGDISATFASRIDGCFYNVVGLPISKLYVSVINFQKQLGLG